LWIAIESVVVVSSIILQDEYQVGLAPSEASQGIVACKNQRRHQGDQNTAGVLVHLTLYWAKGIDFLTGQTLI
jgi:hypothetical protein